MTNLQFEACMCVCAMWNLKKVFFNFNCVHFLNVWAFREFSFVSYQPITKKKHLKKCLLDFRHFISIIMHSPRNCFSFVIRFAVYSIHSRFDKHVYYYYYFFCKNKKVRQKRNNLNRDYIRLITIVIVV